MSAPHEVRQEVTDSAMNYAIGWMMVLAFVLIVGVVALAAWLA